MKHYKRKKKSKKHSNGSLRMEDLIRSYDAIMKQGFVPDWILIPESIINEVFQDPETDSEERE